MSIKLTCSSQVEVDVVPGGEYSSILHSLSSSRKLALSFLTKVRVHFSYDTLRSQLQACLLRTTLKTFSLMHCSPRMVKVFLDSAGCFFVVDSKLLSISRSPALDDLITYKGCEVCGNNQE